MKRNLALVALLCAACFAAGYAAGHRHVARSAPPAGQSPGASPFLDEMGELNRHHSAVWDRLRETVPEADRDAERKRWRLEYDEAVRDCYARHGRPLPEHLRRD